MQKLNKRLLALHANKMEGSGKPTKTRRLFDTTNGFTLILFNILDDLSYNLFSILNRLVSYESRSAEERHL